MLVPGGYRQTSEVVFRQDQEGGLQRPLAFTFSSSLLAIPGSNYGATDIRNLNEIPEITVGCTALQEMAAAAVLLDAEGTAVYANPAAKNLLGDALPEVLAGPPPGASANSQVLTFANGLSVAVERRSLPAGGFVLTFADANPGLSQAELVRRDALTGLADRAAMKAKLAQIAQDREPAALYLLDLDRFKAINDTLGHPLGDALLCKAAERLLGLVGPHDLVARLGGDEFAVIKREINTPEQAGVLAARIVDLLGRTYVLEGHMMNVSASVGVALTPSDGVATDILLKNADLALYRAKAEGRGRFRFFEPSMDAVMQERRTLELELRHALAVKEFKLEYQPQVRLASGEITGFEAILRWEHSQKGLIPAETYMGVAEETGLIINIGEWMIRNACKDAASWTPPVSIAVNLTPLQLRSRKLLTTVRAALLQSRLDPRRLELEITEEALLAETEEVVAMLHSFRELGVRISMDKFGTGYSSLSYLQKFPFDKIKIDHSFTSNVLNNPQCSAIVRAVAAIGASFGMKTTAEGVETVEQMEAIRGEGCDEVQGYHTGIAISASEAAAALAAAPATRILAQERTA